MCDVSGFQMPAKEAKEQASGSRAVEVCGTPPAGVGWGLGAHSAAAARTRPLPGAETACPEASGLA